MNAGDICKYIERGKADLLLSGLYGRPASALSAYRERIIRITEGFQKTFGTPPQRELQIWSAPGRTEIGGNHTDHQGGQVLAAAVNLDAVCCAAPNRTDHIRVFSEGFGITDIDITDLTPRTEERGQTAGILRGIAAGLRRLYADARLHGFDAYVSSDVPGGSGLSSSACFEILMGTVMNGLFLGDRADSVELAGVGRYAENVYFGKPSGLLDQMGCAMGGIVYMDFCSPENPLWKTIPFNLSDSGYALCIIDTGGDHSQLTDDYAKVPAEMQCVAACFGKERLCEVPEDIFYAALPRLRTAAGDRALLRSMHYYAECRRAEAEAKALTSGDFPGFLKCVQASGSSSFRFLQNVDTYREPARQPVALALAFAEQLLQNNGAVRVHGGGFAGTIQAYVPREELTSFVAAMDGLLGEGACHVTGIRAVGGCRLIG